MATETKYQFYKNKPNDTIWWVDNTECIGEHLFSYDKEQVFNVFADYPQNLTTKQRAIFDKENPEWAELLVGR